MRKLSLTLLAVLLVAGYALSQRTITGTVTDESGEPIIGANILVKGTSTGTVTDFDGNYSLEVPEGTTELVFSYTGFEPQERDIGAASVVDIVMVQGIVLETAVVTALGIEREKDALGYSVVDVDGSKMQQVSEPDPLRALQGKVAGVQIQGTSGAPGSSTRLTIRGNSSLLGNNQPLYVVDGVPYDNSEYRTYNQLGSGGAYSSRIADIDPNNIASVNILKGAAAAALYGSRAANGVVVITTKSGKSGLSNKKFEMTLSSSVAWENIANLPDYQNTYGTGTNFNYQQVNGSWGAPFIGSQPYATVDSIPHWYQGRPGMEAFNGVNVPYRAYGDNVRDLFRTGHVYDNSLNVSAANDKSSINATMSYTKNLGYVPNTEFTRAALNVGARTTLANGFRLGATLGYTLTDQAGVISGVGGSGANNNSAFARALYLGRNWDVHGQPYQNPVDLGSEFMVGRGQADNPLWSYENAGIRTDVDRITGSFDLGYDITNWLNVKGVIGVNSYSQRNLDFLRPGSTGPRANPGVGRITNDNINFLELDANFFVTLQRNLTEKIGLRAMVGTNVNQRRTDRQAYQGLTYVVFDIDDIDNTNSVVPFGGTFSKRRIIGAFGDVTLDYDNWAYLTITGRNDWSSTLPTDNRSFFYPAVTGSVILTEAFDLDGTVINYAKLRASWSQVGNDTDPYQLQPVFLINDFYNTSPLPTAQLPFQATGGPIVPGASLSNIERDPNLKPERTTEFEVGTEIGLFNDRINLDFTYYNRNSEDLIAPVSLPSSSGFTQFFTNFGKVSNEGFEVGLRLRPISTSNGFNWEIYTAFTRNKNVVEELTDGVTEIQIEPGSSFAGGVIGVLRPGEEYGVLKGSVDARDEDGNLLIDPSNGQMIRSLTPGVIGNPNPDFILGVTNTFSFKGLTLSAVFDWRQGGDLWSNTILSMLGRGVTKDTEDRETMVVIPGVYGDPNSQQAILDEDGNKIPNQTMIEVNTLYFGETFGINGANEWTVFDATVYRLREVSLGYDFPTRLLDNTPFGALHVGVTGRNLWFDAPHFPEHTNFDPEVNQFGATNKQGIEWSATPSTKRYAVNLRITF